MDRLPCTDSFVSVVPVFICGFCIELSSWLVCSNFWSDFCDWYVELAKPLLAGEDEALKAETQAAAAWTLAPGDLLAVLADRGHRSLHGFSMGGNGARACRRGQQAHRA